MLRVYANFEIEIHGNDLFDSRSVLFRVPIILSGKNFLIQNQSCGIDFTILKEMQIGFQNVMHKDNNIYIKR